MRAVWLDPKRCGVRLKRRGKSPPSLRVSGVAGETPCGARQNRGAGRLADFPRKRKMRPRVLVAPRTTLATLQRFGGVVEGRLEVSIGQGRVILLDLPIDFDRCLTPQGAIKPMSLINAIVRRPSKLPNLVRFGRQSNQAAQRLASFLDDFIAALPVAQEKVAAV